MWHWMPNIEKLEDFLERTRTVAIDQLCGESWANLARDGDVTFATMSALGGVGCASDFQSKTSSFLQSSNSLWASSLSRTTGSKWCHDASRSNDNGTVIAFCATHSPENLASGDEWRKIILNFPTEPVSELVCEERQQQPSLLSSLLVHIFPARFN